MMFASRQLLSTRLLPKPGPAIRVSIIEPCMIGQRHSLSPFHENSNCAACRNQNSLTVTVGRRLGRRAAERGARGKTLGHSTPSSQPRVDENVLSRIHNLLRDVFIPKGLNQLAGGKRASRVPPPVFTVTKISPRRFGGGAAKSSRGRRGFATFPGVADCSLEARGPYPRLMALTASRYLGCDCFFHAKDETHKASFITNKLSKFAMSGKRSDLGGT